MATEHTRSNDARRFVIEVLLVSEEFEFTGFQVCVVAPSPDDFMKSMCLEVEAAAAAAERTRLCEDRVAACSGAPCSSDYRDAVFELEAAKADPRAVLYPDVRVMGCCVEHLATALENENCSVRLYSLDNWFEKEVLRQIQGPTSGPDGGIDLQEAWWRHIGRI